MAKQTVTASNLRTINFKGFIKDLTGKELKDAKKSELLSNMIANSVKGDAVKLYGWAVQIRMHDGLHLDKSDINTLKDMIQNSESLTILSKGQLLECFEDVETL